MQFIVKIETTSIVKETKIIQADTEPEAFQLAKSSAMKLYGPDAVVQLVSVVPMNPATVEQQLELQARMTILAQDE